IYADAATKSLLGHRAPTDFAEEKADSGIVRYFPNRQVFQEATAQSDKFFSTMQTMLTSNSV
ncbi:MAG: hypothetical protein II949_14620, partial [Prevotella sp.]|nr:hypothetical protein [Prevotella sp.]